MRSFVCLLCAIAAFFTAHAEEPDSLSTRVSIGGGIGIGVNLHTANFSQLNSMPVCCAEFRSGIGLHTGFHLQIRYNPEGTLFRRAYHYGLRASFMGLGGTLTDDENIGMVINGGTVVQGEVRHTIDAAYSVLGFEPFIQAHLIEGLPLSGTLGLMAGFPISTSYQQREELTSPSDPSITFETGTRTRGVANGELPTATSPMFAATLGVGYEIPNGRLVFEPRFEAILGLTDVTPAVPWGVAGYRLGLQVHTVLRKHLPEPEPPAPPPPVIEEAPKARIPVLASKLLIPEIMPSSTQGLIRTTVTQRYIDAAPILFFEKNSTAVVTSADAASQLQQDVVTALRFYLADHPEAKLTIIGSAAFDEDIAIARERVSYVTRALGVLVERLERQTVKRTAVDYPELAEEQRSVQFMIDGASRVVRVERAIDSAVRVSSLRIPIGHIITCDTSCTSGVTATLNGTQLTILGTAPTYTMVLDSASLVGLRDGGVINVRGNVAFEGYSATSSQDVTLAIVPDAPLIRYVMASSVNTSQPSATLCYFDFNSSQVSSVNSETLERARVALRAGKTVEVIAGTDHLGTDNANATLADRRASSAIELIRERVVESGQLSVVVNKTSSVENTTPMQRIANRSVRVRIID